MRTTPPRVFAQLASLAMLVSCQRLAPAGSGPEPTGVEPAHAPAGAPVRVAIHGQHFAPVISASFGHSDQAELDDQFQARLGDVALQDVRFVSEEELDATVPAELAAGRYDLTVSDPAGRSGTLAGAFVIDASTTAALTPVSRFELDPVAPQVAGAPFALRAGARSTSRASAPVP